MRISSRSIPGAPARTEPIAGSFAGSLARLLACFLVCLVALGPASLATAQSEVLGRVGDQPTEPPPTEAPPTEAPAPEAEAAPDLLDELETADADLDRLSARIQYTREFAIQGDTQQRRGELFYERDTAASGDGDPPTRRFAIRFNELVVAQRREAYEQLYTFDGEWVVEKIPAEKQFTKRQVVPPGETFDPLRIGEGPFPVPLGQRKSDILDRFTAAEPDVTEGLPEAYHEFAIAQQLRQLRLIPHPGSGEADDFDEIRIWYRRFDLPGGGTTLLPQIARTVEPIGDESFVVLIDLEPNGPIDRSVFDTSTPPREEAWNVHVQPWRGQPASTEDAP